MLMMRIVDVDAAHESLVAGFISIMFAENAVYFRLKGVIICIDEELYKSILVVDLIDRWQHSRKFTGRHLCQVEHTQACVFRASTKWPCHFQPINKVSPF